MEGACIVGRNVGRRTVFIAEFGESNEEVVKVSSRVIPLLQSGWVGCGIVRLQVSGVIIDREVDDGGVGKGWGSLGRIST